MHCALVKSESCITFALLSSEISQSEIWGGEEGRWKVEGGQYGVGWDGYCYFDSVYLLYFYCVLFLK